MTPKYNYVNIKILFVGIFLFVNIYGNYGYSQEKPRVSSGNFGLPGLIDLPTALRFPDGELVITHQNHPYIFMTGISFQALPRLGVSFRYGGQGTGGGLLKVELIGIGALMPT